MSVCLLVHADGTRERVVWDQRAIATHLGGAITFVGALDDLHAVIVGLAREAAADLDVNALARTHPHLFHDTDVRGPVVFVGSDDEGEEMDVDATALLAALHTTTSAQKAATTSGATSTRLSCRAPSAT
jgi:hypothetical protein